MFVNLTKLTKLTKEAHKFELIIADIDDHTIITSRQWLVSIGNEFVPNKVKALIMELAGFLPPADTVYKIGKDIEAENITSTCLTTITRLIKNAELSNIKFSVTPVIDDRYAPVRLLQNTQTSQIAAIPENQYQMIDKNCIDYEIEGEPTGPCSNVNTGPLYWFNSIGLVMIAASNLAASNPLLKALTAVDFSEDQNKPED
jgi:hypothetical protein